MRRARAFHDSSFSWNRKTEGGVSIAMKQKYVRVALYTSAIVEAFGFPWDGFKIRKHVVSYFWNECLQSERIRAMRCDNDKIMKQFLRPRVIAQHIFETLGLQSDLLDVTCREILAATTCAFIEAIGAFKAAQD